MHMVCTARETAKTTTYVRILPTCKKYLD